MRRFNPDKELYKIQHGNRNKIIFGVISLLLIISIGSTYALYQIRYSKRIIYTKVAPFSIHDLDLAIYVDGTKVSTMPTKGTAYYDGITCENDTKATASWDYVNWKLDSINTTIPNKCDIKFITQKPLLTEKIKSISGTSSNLVIDDETDDNNLRYIGATPNNYIWFNCSDYNNLTQSTAKTKCELWRIIGLMNNITKTSGGRGSLVKIIREEKIGDMPWNGNNSNNWTISTLQTTLNEDYLNPSSGTYTSSTSIKALNTTTQGMVESVAWNLGQTEESQYYTASQAYSLERGVITQADAPIIWPGKVGLMYLSDYGYATNGDNASVSRLECISKNLPDYSQGCRATDWLYVSGMEQWVLTPLDHRTRTETHAWFVSAEGEGTAWYGFVTYTKSIRPALYLKSTVKISSGTGSSTEPYILTS